MTFSFLTLESYFQALDQVAAANNYYWHLVYFEKESCTMKRAHIVPATYQSYKIYYIDFQTDFK